MPDISFSSEQRQTVIDRAHGCCEYCWSQANYATQSFSVEHIVPRSKGGATTLDNLALSCQGCNNHKYTKTESADPANQVIVPLYNPRKDQWQSHFVWSDDYTLLLGITPIGRATVDALQINRSGVVNLRRILYQVGEHPPYIRQQDEE